LLIRVVTYNIHRAIGVDRRFRPERIIRILHHHNPDVVLLQEVDEGAPRSRELDMARELAAELGFRHFAVGHNVSLRRGRYGNATLSRFPILRERNIDLSVETSWIRRGCQHTSIQPIEGRPVVEVFNLHLGLSARERQRQVELLARSSEFAGLGPDVPCLVAGDFNDWRSRLRPAFTNGLGFHCATDRRSMGMRSLRKVRPLLTFPSFSPRGGLDRIYYRGPLRLLGVRRCRLQVSRLASDHLPVIAEFQYS
jgi:endonuclease/exonuclease/phosphatase family metal-dependent hydrolase